MADEGGGEGKGQVGMKAAWVPIAFATDSFLLALAKRKEKESQKQKKAVAKEINPKKRKRQPI
jgi:hypothetical protein